MIKRICPLLILFAAGCPARTNIRPEQLFAPMEQSLQWKTPTSMSQETVPASALGASLPPPPLPINYNSNYPAFSGAQQFDQRVSDVIAFNVLRFAHNVGQQLAENAYSSKNEVFSPLSVMSALALLMLGAKGRSYQELKQVFGLDTDAELSANPSKLHEELGLMIADIQRFDENAVQMRKNADWRNTYTSSNMRGGSSSAQSNKPVEHVVRVANGLFEQTGFSLNTNYRDVLQSIYNGDIVQLDFHNKPTAARDYINGWVNSNTYGKIPTIINGPIPRSTNLIIASALYFKGFWENTFIEAATVSDSFYPDGPRQPHTKVQMMATGGIFPYYESAEYDCRIIGLPYKGNSTTMYVIQPHYSTRARLREFQKFMDAQKIEEIISKMTRKTAVLALPKMHITRNTNMKSILNRIGLTNIFTSGLSDLSLIGAEPPKYASSAGNSAARLPPPSSLAAASPPLTAMAADRAPQIAHLIPPQYTIRDRFEDSPLIFSRFGELDQNIANSSSSDTAQEVSELKESEPVKRQVSAKQNALANLEAQRKLFGNYRSDLFVEDILHKVDFDVNEHGTEAAAATLTYLRRSGTDVLFRAEAPFLVLIRHDPTKLVLFYGIINEPE